MTAVQLLAAAVIVALAVILGLAAHPVFFAILILLIAVAFL